MKMYQRRVVAAAVILAVIAAVLVYKEKRSSNQVKSQVHELIQKLPSYATEKAYLDHIFSTNHETAFSASYDPGGRRRSASFDAKKYITQVFDGMAAQARTDGKDDLASEVLAMKILLQVQTDDTSPPPDTNDQDV